MANSFSVTEKPCHCGTLQRCADDPDSPIIFDPETNEYQFVPDSTEKYAMILYHCPICGGKAPASKRALLFATISDVERERLYGLLEGINVLDDAIRILGTPDDDQPRGVTESSSENDGHPPVSRSFRVLIYDRLSETVTVSIADSLDGRARVSLQGKFIGPPRM